MSDLERLIFLQKTFFHLKESGMFEGKFGDKEANRRNKEIVELRQKLNLTKKQVAIIINKESKNELL